MENIKILEKKELDATFEFDVELDSKKFKVILSRDYWRALTDENHTPEKLIKESFRFLLEREPKESILSEFDIKVINKYFPEFEDEIAKRF